MACEKKISPIWVKCLLSHQGKIASTHPPTYRRKITAYLEITLKIAKNNRAAAAEVYTKYKKQFLEQVKGAQGKELLLRDEDVQILHRFATSTDAEAYIKSDFMMNDVGKSLVPYLETHPEIRIYDVA